MLKIVAKKIKSFYRNLKWSCQALFVRCRLKTKSVMSLDDADVTYMVLIPHADDEWIGCSQIIRKMKSVLLVDTDMDGGDTPSIHNKRKDELRRISEMFNHPLYIIGKNKANDLLQIIEQKSPNYILVPFFYDWHPEHIMVMNVLEQLLKSETLKSNVLMYQVSVPIGTKWINRVMPMSKQDLKEKWNVFKNVYKTQLHLPSFRFAMNEHINGFFSRSFAAEVFVHLTGKEWLDQKTNITEKALKDKELILSNLNNIQKIRTIVEW